MRGSSGDKNYSKPKILREPQTRTRNNEQAQEKPQLPHSEHFIAPRSGPLILQHALPHLAV